ncbi:MAG TPA: putative Ig domain-containing protein [Terriglobales bacterium]|jgi:adhesin HecA-like repeat protein|nr:putative Ig domain-containing protein [Terriglobales bacterium]
MKGAKPFLYLLLGIVVCVIISGCAAKAPANGPGALNIAQFTLSQGVPGISYRQLLIASGGTQPYTWSISSGSLPPGLNLTSDGIISGTPTTTGTFSFTAKVVDSQTPVQAVTMQNFSIMINPPLSLASMALPNGIVGNTYLTTVQASNGVAPYAYTLVFGSLPPCAPNPPCTDGTMTLTTDMPPMGGGPNTGTIKTPSDGMMLSTLSDAGVYDFTIQATDALGEVATATFSITVTGRLQGPYAFTFNGFNQNLGQPFYMVGSFIADGNGGITSGVFDQASPSGVNSNVAFTGTYNLPVGSTTGTITITSSLGMSNYSITVSTTSDSQLIETDMNVYGSGLVKKQSTTALPVSASSYAFGLFGADSSGNRYAGAGAFLLDTMLNVTGGEEDTNDNGTASGQLTISGGTLANPDGMTGRGTLTLTIGGTDYHYAYYTSSILTNELVALATDTGGPFTIVDLLPQAAGGVTGNFSNSTLTCQGPGACSVMSVNGATGSAVPQAGIGTATFDGMGTITRSGIDMLPGFFMDQSVGGTVSQLSYCTSDDPSPCTYNVDTTGRVTVTLTDSGGNPVANPPVWYLVTKNSGFIVGTDPAVTSGRLVPQSGAPFTVAQLLGSYLGGTITPTTSSVTNELDVAGTPPPGGTWAVTYQTNGPGGYQMNNMPFMGPYTFDTTYGPAFGRFTVATTGGQPVLILYIAGTGSAGATGGKTGLLYLNVGLYDGTADPNPRLTSLGR